jgi:hypothetical protein
MKNWKKMYMRVQKNGFKKKIQTSWILTKGVVTEGDVTL